MYFLLDWDVSCEVVITYLSMSESLIVVAMALGCVSLSLKTLSMTDSSVLVVSSPQKAHQSFTTIPAAITSLPRLIVPAFRQETTTRLSIIQHQCKGTKFLANKHKFGGFPPKHSSYFSLGFDDIVNNCVPISLQKWCNVTYIYRQTLIYKH